ncbi:MAG TPA: alpha/beta hydrolase [Planctomycetota bacterium]|nr:alpha/beta hydrolase [Planctomycetota bacterium]
MKRLFPALLLAVALALPAGAQSARVVAPPPTKADEKYDTKHERNVLDFWAAKSDKPAPLVVWFHGGGFTQGDKRQIVDRDNVVGGLLAKGVSVASCNYPFLKDASYEQIMVHCARAIQFLRSKAKEWNFDPARIGVAGASAGALISEWLGYHADLAKPGSADPVEQLSSVASAVGGIQQPMGTDELVRPLMKTGGAPLFLFTTAAESDSVHHPKYAKLMKARADELKIPVEIYGGPKNDLPGPPAGETYSSVLLKFFFRQFGIKA